MQFAPLSLLLALAALAAAQSTENPFKLNGQIQIKAGQPYTIEWNPTTQGPVDLKLRAGANSDLKDVTDIASNIPNNGKYTFTIPADTTRNSDYTIQINPAGKPDEANYTPQFVVDSSNTVQSNTNSASAAATTGKTTSTDTKSSSTKTSSGSSSSTSGSSSKTSSSSATSAAAATTASSAPTSGAAVNNVLKVQGGLAAVLVGAAMLL